MELPNHIGINKHGIKLVEAKLPHYSLIYNSNQVELKTLKMYIETHLKTEFIHLFKSPTKGPIFFDKKSNKNLRLYLDYQGPNNLTIENRSSLSLISESVDKL